MLNKFAFFLIALILIFGGSSVLAQEDAIDLDEDVQSEDLGISEPRILPDSPFYFFKEWGREIQGFFTFNPIAKAKLKERFANEKLIELKKTVEQEKSRERIEKAIKNYENGIEEAKRATERIRERAEENEEVGKFLDKFIQHNALHQRVLQKLEEQVPPEVFEKIKEAREMHLERFGEVMNKLQENKEQLQERLEKNLQEIQGGELRKETIQIRDRILEKVQQKKKGGPAACITLWDPVCGKDGKTYSNDCFAKVAGVTVVSKGACELICGGIQGIICPSGYYCKYEGDYPDASGKCIEKKEECQSEPVCRAVGTRSEGWYDSCTGELIKWENCGGAIEPGCQTLWWFDNEHKFCQQNEKCDFYMYLGLRTFNTKEECESAL